MAPRSSSSAGSKLPKNLGACADEVGDIDRRVDEIARKLSVHPLNKELEALGARRKLLEAKLLEELPASQATGVAGQRTRVTVKTKRVPVIQDYDVLIKFIKKTGAFDLLQRRLSVEAVQERWDEKKQVPGIGGFTVKKLSITKA